MEDVQYNKKECVCVWGGEGSKVPKKVYDYIFEQPLRRNGHTFLVDFLYLFHDFKFGVHLHSFEFS